MHRFNVFGIEMSVHRINDEWHLFKESEIGLRTRVYDVVIPPDLLSNELSHYLDDIYHELANKKHCKVIALR